jgi:outer membrane protein
MSISRTPRRLLLALALGLAVTPVLTVANDARAEVPAVKKIVLVDMQRVLNETKAGRKARSGLETSSKAKQEKLDKRRSKLEADAAKLQSLKGEALAQAQERLQRDSMELQETLMTLENELGEQHNALLESIYGNTQKIVTKLAQERGIDLVLVRDAMTVLYAKDGFDLTDEIIKLYDAKHAS